jgi:lipopolysaccharide/colanic/teichoic acid biosynthesis glycosyltransferase
MGACIKYFKQRAGFKKDVMVMKRLFDIVMAGASFIILSPLIWIILLSIRVFQGKRIFFRQLRPGKDGRAFEILKFCTMTDGCDAAGCLLPDADRLTWIGRFLRSTSLDELPEFWNVLKGDMSIVGPRPLLMQYLDRYTPEQARRHAVKPGITGWAQVNGRNAISWEEKFRLDVWYVDHGSVALDLRIILMTVLKVVQREGINSEDDTTMPEFMGHAKMQRR